MHAEVVVGHRRRTRLLHDVGELVAEQPRARTSAGRYAPGAKWMSWPMRERGGADARRDVAVGVHPHAREVGPEGGLHRPPHGRPAARRRLTHSLDPAEVSSLAQRRHRRQPTSAWSVPGVAAHARSHAPMGDVDARCTAATTSAARSASPGRRPGRPRAHTDRRRPDRQLRLADREHGAPRLAACSGRRRVPERASDVAGAVGLRRRLSHPLEHSPSSSSAALDATPRSVPVRRRRVVCRIRHRPGRARRRSPRVGGTRRSPRASAGGPASGTRGRRRGPAHAM